jgi:nitrogen-specific signal transduction histidine kinase
MGNNLIDSMVLLSEDRRPHRTDLGIQAVTDRCHTILRTHPQITLNFPMEKQMAHLPYNTLLTFSFTPP